MSEQQRTYRLVTKDEALVGRVVHDIEQLVKQQHGAHALAYKVVPPMTHDARGFTRVVYLHTKTDHAAELVRGKVADIGAMTCKEG